MKKGILIYDSSTNRFDILYEEGNSYCGLHCGTAMPTRFGSIRIKKRKKLCLLLIHRQKPQT